MTFRRMFTAALLALGVVLAAAACDTFGPGYCYGEGGQVQACVSPGSPGSGG